VKIHNIIFALFIFGCAAKADHLNAHVKEPSSQPLPYTKIVTPNGGVGYAINCNYMKQCFSWASYLCNEGYSIISKTEDSKMCYGNNRENYQGYESENSGLESSESSTYESSEFSCITLYNFVVECVVAKPLLFQMSPQQPEPTTKKEENNLVKLPEYYCRQTNNPPKRPFLECFSTLTSCINSSTESDILCVSQTEVYCALTSFSYISGSNATTCWVNRDECAAFCQERRMSIPESPCLSQCTRNLIPTTPVVTGY
jgi:hypothetical protein